LIAVYVKVSGNCKHITALWPSSSTLIIHGSYTILLLVWCFSRIKGKSRWSNSDIDAIDRHRSIWQ